MKNSKVFKLRSRFYLNFKIVKYIKCFKTLDQIRIIDHCGTIVNVPINYHRQVQKVKWMEAKLTSFVIKEQNFLLLLLRRFGLPKQSKTHDAEHMKLP